MLPLQLGKRFDDVRLVPEVLVTGRNRHTDITEELATDALRTEEGEVRVACVERDPELNGE